jgi:hypothetical protein
MKPALEILLFGLVVGLAAVAGGWVLVWELTPERRRQGRIRVLAAWSAKGLLVPLIIWTLMNLGLSWNLQAFMPEVQAAQNSGGDWIPVYLRVLALGVFAVTSYWTAVTLGWAVFEAGAGAEGEAREQFKSLCLTCFIGMVIPAAALVYFGGWTLLGLAGTALLAPMAGYGGNVLHIQPTTPMYARAVARMNFGKYSEAEWEIIRELEKCEDDFDGWMMLAELYAKQFGDLAQAEQTILEICDQPRTTPSQLSVALHRLADWQLERLDDPAAARRTLQMICRRLPGTHLARMAQLRINQLPATRAELREQHEAKPIPLPALGDSVEQGPAPAESRMERHQAAQEANDCVDILKQDPNNVHVREKLARLFADHLGQPDLGIEQASLLLDLPDQPQARRAEWLSLIAAWHLKYRHDSQAGRDLLERLLREHPDTPQAFAARRRLQLLEAAARESSGAASRTAEPS